MANAKKPGPPATEPLLSTSISSAAHSSGTSCGTGIDLLSCSRDLQDRLAELRRRLTPKPFKCHFVDSLIYIIRLEHRNQTEFDEAIYSAYIQWSQLDYALNELKKIIKQKQAIRSLITKMQLHSRPNNHQTAIATAIQNNCSNSNSSLFDEYSDSSNGCPDKIELSCELDDLNTNNNDDLFSLVKILIRFLFKLIKLKVKNPSKETQVSTASIRLNKQLFNLKLILISCLADLFNFEDIKIQAINDSNLKCLLRIFAVTIRSELEATAASLNKSSNSSGSTAITTGNSIKSILTKRPSQAAVEAITNMAVSLSSHTSQTALKTFYNAKKYWTKMCRLAANLCVQESSAQVKSLFANDFFASLFICIDKQNQMFQSQANLIDIDSNMNDIEFLISLIRFLKYSCEMNKLKQRILEYRFLVFLCRFVQRYNKTIQFSSDPTCQNVLTTSTASITSTQKTQTTNNDTSANISNTSETTSTTTTVSTTSSSTESTVLIVLNEKCHTMCKELIMNYLQLLDGWPACSEFYNQIIEGNLIDHLVWLQIDDTTELKSITSRVAAAASSSSTKPPNSSSKSESFNFAECSFNLIYKLCRDYHACRAEFGRIGGLAKYIAKIELTELKTNESKLIEVLCFSCKESVNRFRLKEQNHLSFLLKLQQCLKKKASLQQKPIENSEKVNCLDSALFNKLLVAICGFVHDPDSMNVLLANGLVDSFLSFLNDSYKKHSEVINQASINIDELNMFRTALFSLSSTPLKRTVLLKTMLAKTSSTDLTLENRKRKACEQTITNEPPPTPTTIGINKSKKFKLNRANTPSSPPSFSNATSPINVFVDYSTINHHYNEQHSTASPTESYCSLSPACNPFSPTFSLSSPPAAAASTASTTSRCTSAIHFHTTNFTNMYSLNSNSYQFSPSPSSNDAMAASPKFNWSSSGEDLIYYQNSNNTIQFSPSIKNEDSEDEEIDQDEIEQEPAQSEEKDNFKEDQLSSIVTTTTTTIEITEEVEDVEEETEIKKKPKENYSKKQISEQSKALPSLTNQQSIETINRTEGCVFYVLSQLSHGDKPSTYMFNNFEAITVCLLNYLKNAQVRNPRALRILNRLTKNTYCFSFFIIIQLPFKIKKILFDSKENTHSPTSFKKKDQDIEKEMNVYLNSNKVFFDAHSSFPSFESIEFTLINNLKSQCISSSDHGYLSLIQMIKLSNQKKQERLSCALVAPFILRNSKALHYIMIQLSGIDPVLDTLLMFASEESIEERLNLRNKSILCLRKVLTFVNYKRDMKKLKENFEQSKLKLSESINTNQLNQSAIITNQQEETVTFLFKENDEIKELKANKEIIVRKSEYFNALLNGQFMESNKQPGIEIKQVSYEAFQVLIDLIQSDFLVSNSCDLTFELCIEIVMACDRLMLNDLKDFFVSILVNNFMSLNTFVLMFKLAWYLNINVLEQATVDYFLSMINLFKTESETDTDLDTVNLNKSELDLNLKCAILIDYVLDGFKQNDQTLFSSRSQFDSGVDKQLMDHFKKSLRIAIGEIIKK